MHLSIWGHLELNLKAGTAHDMDGSLCVHKTRDGDTKDFRPNPGYSEGPSA